MNRRSFLKTTTGAAVGAPFLNTLFARGLSTTPIKHIVVCMMENRSFDHVLGWFPNSDGKQAGLSYIDNDGVTHSTAPLGTDTTGCGLKDPDHSYDGARVEYNNGLMDGFLKVNDTFSIGYYTESDRRFLSAFARHFTLCQRYFPSILGPTFSNRIFQHCGQTDRLDDSFSPCSLPTIWDSLASSNISHKYYYGNLPLIALFGLKYLNISNPFSTFLADCQAGTLPAVSFVDPSFTVVLNFANDDHPHSDIRNADAFLAQVYQAVAASPNWNETVLVVNYDEWGGFFEHIVPPRALAPNSVDPDLVDGKALLGLRVPAVVCSPWTLGHPRNPTVNSTVFDHTSVLKLIESVFNVAPLAARETSSDVGNILDIIPYGRTPLAAPSLPTPRPVFPTQVCSSSIEPGVATVYQKAIDAGVFEGWKLAAI